MIKIYSIPNCRYCGELKGLLTNANIPFIDADITTTYKEEFDVLAKQHGIAEIPVINIEGNLLVPNKSFQSIQQAFEMTKKFLV